MGLAAGARVMRSELDNRAGVRCRRLTLGEWCLVEYAHAPKRVVTTLVSLRVPKATHLTRLDFSFYFDCRFGGGFLRARSRQATGPNG
jgi:hypothetical protein